MAQLSTTALLNDANLLGYWKFENNSNDSKGSNNGTDTSMSYTTGKYGQAASFNGSTGFINIGTAINLTGNFSISVWVNPTSIASQQLFICDDNSSGQRQYSFGINNSGKPYFERAGVVIIGNVGTAIAAGSFTHLLIVYDGTNITSYINGVQDYQTTMTALPSSANSTLFGRREFSGSNVPFGGLLDDIGIFNRALSAQEAVDLASAYSSSISPSSSLSPSASRSPSASISPSSSSSPSLSPSASRSPSSSVSSSPSASLSPSSSRSPSSSVSPSISPSSSLSSSLSPSPSAGYSLYSRAAVSGLPTDTTDLATLYSDSEELLVAKEDDIFVNQAATLAYMVQQFKNFIESQTEATIEVVAKSSLAPTLSTVYLQIFNTSTLQWETVDSNNIHPAGVSFVLTEKMTDIRSYVDASHVLAYRVYQLAI